ncbi:WW domain containing protein [Coccidioides immitis RMSCC 3703]|nr:WW domain containing protein [Coccidioides immitis RMSCC 3703]
MAWPGSSGCWLKHITNRAHSPSTIPHAPGTKLRSAALSYDPEEGQPSNVHKPEMEEDRPAANEKSKGGETGQQETDGKKSGEDTQDGDAETRVSAPPLPAEEAPPPLPNEPIPGGAEDDGWDALWDDSAQAYYFYNRFTGVSQWENPRIPDAQQGPPGVESEKDGAEETQQQRPRPRVAGGYDPAIHGDYDPDAWYAQPHPDDTSPASTDPSVLYTATGAFNRFTGKWQPLGLTPENFNDENKSRRQLNAYFDVDAAANSHEGRSLKAERSGKKLTKKELKAFKEKRREKKEEKRRAWLRD